MSRKLSMCAECARRMGPSAAYWVSYTPGGGTSPRVELSVDTAALLADVRVPSWLGGGHQSWRRGSLLGLGVVATFVGPDNDGSEVVHVTAKELRDGPTQEGAFLCRVDAEVRIEHRGRGAAHDALAKAATEAQEAREALRKTEELCERFAALRALLAQARASLMRAQRVAATLRLARLEPLPLVRSLDADAERGQKVAERGRELASWRACSAEFERVRLAAVCEQLDTGAP